MTVHVAEHRDGIKTILFWVQHVISLLATRSLDLITRFRKPMNDIFEWISACAPIICRLFTKFNITDTSLNVTAVSMSCIFTWFIGEILSTLKEMWTLTPNRFPRTSSVVSEQQLEFLKPFRHFKFNFIYRLFEIVLYMISLHGALILFVCCFYFSVRYGVVWWFVTIYDMLIMLSFVSRPVYWGSTLCDLMIIHVSQFRRESAGMLN